MSRISTTTLALVVLLLTTVTLVGAFSAQANPPLAGARFADETSLQQVKNHVAKREDLLRLAASLRKKINHSRQSTCYWRRVALLNCSVSRVSPHIIGVAYLSWLRRKSGLRLKKAWHYAQNPPHKHQWLCIHRYEGSWKDSGIGDPPRAEFWGGLQFGPSEWRKYGGRFAPTANLATPLEQMWAAEAYYRAPNGHGGIVGFQPWPNTAHYCGLI